MWSSAAAGDAHATTASTASASSIATGAATPTANGQRTQQSPGVWSFDNSPFDAAGSSSSSASTSTTATTTNGVIGAGYVHSHVSKSRLLWNRTAPEEEEREEEALPSYLTYLQPSFRSSVASTTSGNDQRIQQSSSSFVGGAGGLSGGWGDDALSQRSSLSASSSHFIPSSASAFTAALSSTVDGPFVSAASPTGMYSHSHTHHESSNSNNNHGGHGVETKSKELAFALQEFVRQQVEMQAAQQQNQHHRNASTSSSSPLAGSQGGCQCEPLKRRVVDLEQKLLTLSQQVAGLMGNGASSTVHNPSINTTVLAGPPGLAPPLQPLASIAMAGTPSMLQQQPPLPPTPPHSGGLGGVGAPMGTLGSPSAAAAAVSGINDRVSTLEGRQSAFQSQLAQISKVLGVPIGKHGKNAQIKNLVQTLREEIDGKLSTSAKEIEAKCVQTVAETLGSVVVQAVDERLQQANGNGGAAGNQLSSSTAASQLSYDAVFGALAEEHEASLAKLSAYYEERLVQESKQRVALESRIQSRFGEHEEWLQQLEGEFGSWHDRSSTVASQLRVLQTKIHEMDDKWKAEQLKWSKVAADLQLGVVVGSGNTPVSSMPSASSSSTTTTTSTISSSTGASVETLTRTVHQLQTQYKQFHSEYKTETSELRENLVLMETWVKTTRQETRDLGKSTKGMKQLVEKLVRDTGSAEELLQQYVSTITHQVASVTRQYVSVRIRDNNRLIDATLRARVPAYLENESESFMLVRPEPKSGTSHEAVMSSESHHHSSGLAASFVLKDDDEDAIRKLLKQEHTSSESSGASSPVAATSYK